MITLQDAAPGLHVYYTSHPGALPEYGAISSCNERYVFVLFIGYEQPMACRPVDLHWPPYYCAFDGACPDGQIYDQEGVR